MSALDLNFLGGQNLSDLNLEYLGSKKEITKEWLGAAPQNYTGETLHGNIHGHGFYFVEKEDKIFYDGLFYANKLEGYSQVFYNDGCNFQGLFKDNIRFGPGVLTYPNGEQDVGLWMGQSLIRLGGLNDRNVVPRLATTPIGQLKLLKYRYLVPVCPKHVDIAYNTLKQLGANERVLQNSHLLYNMEVGNKSNIFFNKRLYNKQFYTDQDCCIDIVVSDDEEEDFKEDKKTESQEEISTNPVDINVERVRQLSQQLEIIEGRLKSITEKRMKAEGKVEKCKSCCHYEQSEQKSTQSTVDTVEEEEEKEKEKRDSNDYDNFGLFRQPSVRIDEVVRIETYSAVSGDDYSAIDEEDTTVTGYEIDDLCVQSNTTDVTAQIKDYLMDTCVCDETQGIEDLYELQKQLDALKKDEAFFECILKNLKQKLKMHIKKSEGSNEVKTRKISVKDVLAWNNEELCMRMLKHGFLHRNSEYMVCFDVSDLIAGNRHQFGERGLQERNSLDFLVACNDGDIETILKLVRESKINVNVCDAKGNTGMFLAAVNHEIDTIRLLIHLGANINSVNDEGLHPLSMCLLIYLAEKNTIYDWETSFLPDAVEPMIEQKDAYKWYQNMSLNVLARHGKTTHSFIEEVKFKASDMNFMTMKQPDAYFFNPKCVVSVHEARKSVAYNVRVNTSHSHYRRSIDDSIKTLLAYGANPNAGEAPLPPLFLSLFTENLSLVECVLGAKADINTTIEEEMTALHIIVSLQCSQVNADICSLLIEYDCDPRLKTTLKHWPEQKEFILGQDVNPDDVEDFGKNPLHIVCIRRDFSMDRCSFFQQMAMVLSDSRIDCNERYLGHTPLSLAVLVGNQCLVETLMKLHIIDPHQMLDYNMGNVLTIYILKRYQDRLPSNAKAILACLVNLGVNPLTAVGKFENVITFMENEHAVKGKKGKVDKTRDHLGKPKKIRGSEEEIFQYELRCYLVELARKTITKYIQLYTVQNLYNFVEENMMHHRCAIILAEFLTPDIVIPNLQNLFKCGRINCDRFHRDICLKLIDAVNESQVAFRVDDEVKEDDSREFEIDLKKGRDLKESKRRNSGSLKKPKKGIMQSSKKSTRKKKSQSVVINTSDYRHILDMTDFEIIERKKFKIKFPYPGLDNTSKYKVCFYCLRREGKQLMMCPRCQLIYFCSDECNRASLKLDTIHVCNLDFYSSELMKLQSPTNLGKTQNHSELYARLEQNCEERLKRKIKEEKELTRLQFEEERKLDTYGTKWVKWKREQRMTLKRTPTNLTLLGSAGDLARLESEMVSVERQGTYDSIARRTFSGSERHAPLLEFLDTRNEQCKTVEKERQHRPKKKCGHKECIPPEKGGTCCKKDNREVVKRFKMKEEVAAATGTKVVVHKLRNIPTKYETFIGLLTKYFPEVDFSSMFLPYTCYSNGHLYYKFSDNETDKRTYSMM